MVSFMGGCPWPGVCQKRTLSKHSYQGKETNTNPAGCSDQVFTKKFKMTVPQKYSSTVGGHN
jgi:hypothetical protein